MVVRTPDLLKYIDIGASDVLERVTKTVNLPAGRDLFCEGALGRSVFIVRSGSLGVYARDMNGENRFIGLVGPGGTVGEMALISQEPRSATVTAIRDSQLLMLSQSRFQHLLKAEPELTGSLMRLLIHRLRQTTRGVVNAIEPRAIAILPASDGVDAAAIAHRLAGQIELLGDTVHVLDARNASYSSQWFAEREQAHDFIILTAQHNEDQDWIDVCARQADRIVLLADACARRHAPLPDTLLQQRARHQLLDLVLLHRNSTHCVADRKRWHDAIGINRQFHLRELIGSDWSRLARILCGRGVGLVLSGGGARAFAHIGVLQALEEAGIPIDFIGGTSMGGLIGAGVALEWSVDDIKARMRESFAESNPVSDYTLPIVGLVRGRKVERLLEAHFGNNDIQDLWRPYYCVSTNLTRGGDHVHRTGRLCDALRASISLPGILPPVPHEAGLLVDGAVTTNLPVDIMRQSHRGKIIAVDVARDLAISPASLLREQQSTWGKRLFRPPIVSILIRAGTVSSEETDRRQAGNADMLITPPLGEIEIRDWKAFDRAIAIGYRHAAHALETHGEALFAHSA